MNIILVRYHDKENVNTRLPESLNRVQGVLPPLGLAYIAAFIEQYGYKVKIIDAIADNLTKQEFHALLEKEKPTIVGITTMTSTIRGSLEAAQIAKDVGAITVLGGTHMCIYSKETLSYDFVDYGINGEGEYPLLELIRAIESNRKVNEVRGLLYKENGNIFVNDAYIVENLDELPFPARHLLPMEKYSSIIGMHPVTTMITSRGCPYQCGFCFKSPSDKKYRVRTAKNVVDEMEFVVNKYGVREIMFYDDTITLKRESIVAICSEIIERKLKIKWESPARVDNVDYELLKLMNKAGCIRLRYGVESGDENILKLMKKGINLNQVVNAFKWSKEIGIETFAYFIVAYINETQETIKKTISFAKKLNPDLVMFTVATPYPSTNLYQMAFEQGFLKGDYWRDFTLGTQGNRLPYFVENAETWIKKAYFSFYFRPQYILRRLSKIKSFNDFKKHCDAAVGLLFFSMKK